MNRAAMRQSMRAALMAAVLACLAAYGLKESAVAERAEALVFDAQVRWLRAHRPAPEPDSQPQVAIVGIDGPTLDRAGVPLAMIHHQLAAALDRIALARPRAIAIDLVLPDRSVDRWLPGADESLTRALVEAGHRAPVMFVVEPEADGHLRAPYPPYAAALGERGCVTALLPVDGDGVVRRFDPSLTAPGLPTLGGQVAARLGIADRAQQAGWIDYTRGAPFDYTPLLAVSGPEQASDSGRWQAAFEGRVVLIGAVLPFVDRVRLPAPLLGWPYPRTAPPAVVTHAQLLRSLLGHGLIRAVPAPVTALAIALLVLCAALPGLRARCIGLAIGALALTVLSTWLHGEGRRLEVFVPVAAAAVAAVARTGADLTRSQRDRARLSRAFAGYVSPAVLRALLEGRLATTPARREMAFVFADLRGFTAWSEAEPPERVFALLNRYFALVTPVIHELGGTVDNFRGDGIMILFGAPEPHASPCASAFEAARQIVLKARALFESEAGPGGRGLDLAVGVAFGEAVYGDLGSTDRRDFTAIGDAVNVAARLQDLSKSLGCPVLMTMQVHERLGPAADPDDQPRPLGQVELRGHSPVAVAGWRPKA